jgi:hypothetical protein
MIEVSAVGGRLDAAEERGVQASPSPSSHRSVQADPNRVPARIAATTLIRSGTAGFSASARWISSFFDLLSLSAASSLMRGFDATAQRA